MRTNIKLLSFLLITLAIACSKKESINISGSTTVLKVVAVAAEKYKLEHPEVNLIINAGGSGVGINQLGKQNIEIGMASRNITDKEIAQYPEVDFVTHSIGKDAVVPVVSSEVFDAGVQALTLAQIGQIYRGKITNWSVLGGPDKDILVIDKERARGTRHVFMKAVLGDKEADAPGADLVLGANNEEQTAIVQSDAAIGMLSNAWLNKDVKGLSIILEDSTIIAPSLANIINGSFPITRDLYLITNGAPTGAAKNFIDFMLSKKGQQMVEEAGYVKVIQ